MYLRNSGPTDYIRNQIDKIFNQCIINWYPNNENYIAYHSDCTLGMIEKANIAIITLTQNDTVHRIFQIKPKKSYRENANFESPLKIILKHGTFILMNAESHGIPKFSFSPSEEDNSNYDAPRISISFRQFKEKT